MIKVNLGMLNIIYGRYEEAIEVLEDAREYFSQHPDEYERFLDSRERKKGQGGEE